MVCRRSKVDLSYKLEPLGSMSRLATIMTVGLSFGPAQAAELIRCPDAASLMAAEVRISRAPKADFASLVAQPMAPATVPGVGTVSTSPLDPMGLLGSSSAQASTRERTAPASPSASAPSSCTYTVRAGDTLGAIAARQLGSANSWTELQTANPQLKPNALRPGQTIAVPCNASAASVRTLMSPAIPAATKPTVEPTPPAPPLPVWTAKSGEYFSDVVKRWGKAEGYNVLFATTADWRLAVPVREQGRLEDVLDKLAKGLSSNGRPPFIQLFPNKVIRIGGGA